MAGRGGGVGGRLLWKPAHEFLYDFPVIYKGKVDETHFLKCIFPLQLNVLIETGHIQSSPNQKCGGCAS